MHQVEERGHGFDLRAAQVQRIEIELQPRQQREARRRDDSRRNEHAAALPQQESVEPTERRIAHRGALPGWAQERDERRKQTDAGNERNQHAGTGDDAELRHAAVRSRQEGVEARGDRGGGERQSATDLAAGIPQRALQIVVVVALGTIANAELDTKIDAQADEEHGKGNRYEVERAEHEQTKRGRHDQPGAKAQHDRDDEAEGAQRDPQQRHDGQEHDRDVERGAIGKRGELLVGERDRTGLSYPETRIGVESKLMRGGPDRRAGALAGLQRAVIEYRLHEHESAQLVRIGGAPGEQAVPRESRRLAGDDGLEGRGQLRQRWEQLVGLRVVLVHALDEQVERVHEPAQAGVCRQAPQQRLRGDEPLHGLRQRGGRFEQQTLAIEEWPAVGPPYDAKKPALTRQLLGQRRGRLLGEFRGRAVDDDCDQVRVLREGRIEGPLALAPAHVRRDQPGVVGIDRDVLRRVKKRRRQ